MSVGGTVVEIVDDPIRERVWVDTKERQESRRTVAIYVERSPEALSITEGDSLWWQGSYAYWTPRTGRFVDAPPFCDRAIRRVSGSGVPRPTGAEGGSDG